MIKEANIVIGGMFGDNYVEVKEEGDKEFSHLFDFYPDELSFRKDELIGLTRKEAHILKHNKDLVYLRS